MLQKMIEAIKASGNADLIAKLEAFGATPNEDQVMGLYEGLVKQPAAVPKKEAETGKEPAKPAATAQPEGGNPKPTKEAETQPAANGTVRQVNEAEWRGFMAESRINHLSAALAGCSLPDVVKDDIRAEVTEAINGAASSEAMPTKEAITAKVKKQVELFAKLAEGNIHMPATGLPRIQMGAGRREKIQEAFDDFFGVKKDDKVRGGYRTVEASQQKLMSFRGLYQEMTGDMNVTGQVKECTRLTESLTSATFDQILADSITRRMVAEYATGEQAQWRGTIAEVVPVNDMRTQRRMRFGGYGNLPTVAQGAPYAALTSPSDEEATYAAAKRGGTEQLTLEMILNDDVGVIRRIPTKLARCAGQTLYEFVLDFLANNSTIYDSTALAAAGHGNNIVTSALTSSNLSTLRLRMKNQTDMSNSKRLGIKARYLYVPSDLEELAFQLTSSERAVPDSSIASTAQAAAPNFIRKLSIQPVVVDYWTDTNNYWLASSIADTPMIEIGFLGGREEPELFVQDVPNQGSLFSNDVITYKIRHVYGGAVLDFRGFAGGIVA